MKEIIKVRDLNIEFGTNNGVVRAIRGVNFDLYEGEVLSIVGESGSGKSVSSRAVMGLLANNGTITRGSIKFYDKELVGMKEKDFQEIRGKEIAMIFQDPLTSLDPTMNIGKQLIESILKHENISKSESYARAEELLELVGIDNPKIRLKQFPHQFSGGMRQRIVIAIALSCNPKVLICDEPTTALDVTIQAQILELIKDLIKKINLSVIFITHDLGVVANISDRVAVMYAGTIVEVGTAEDIFYDPKHPYTWGLLASMPDLETEGDLYMIPGSPPNLIEEPKGDAFSLRSEYALEIDLLKRPPMFKISSTHSVATWLCHKYAPKVSMPTLLENKIKKMKEEVCE
ncbi:MAG: ABC transporter ATP-binding protein [Bacilli bacterium]